MSRRTKRHAAHPKTNASEEQTAMPTEDRPLAELATAQVSRRRLLIGSTVAAGVALVAAACGDDDESTNTSSGGQTDTTAAQGSSGDLAVAELAAGLEVLAVQTYQAALNAAQANKLGTVPPAVATFVQTALSHHQEHRDFWNGVLRGAGRPEVTTPNAKLKPTVDAEFAKVADVAGAANLALTLEDVAAQTYLKAIPQLKGKDAVRKAAEIQVVDQQHQSILLYALGKYPVPETFQKTEKAAS